MFTFLFTYSIVYSNVRLKPYIFIDSLSFPSKDFETKTKDPHCPDRQCGSVVEDKLFAKALPGKERVGFHGFVDATAHGVDDVLVCRCVEHGFNHFCNFVHEVFLGTAGGDGGSSEANSGSFESTAGVRRHCALSQVVTMVRLMLMYYVDFIAFMENPEKNLE